MITAIADKSALTVADLKAYMKIEHAEEDPLIEDLLATAKLQADHYCQNDFEGFAEIPIDVNMAVMRIAAALYENRADHIAGESVQGISYTAGQIEWNAQRLLQPYRKFFAV